jgi:hypothetical protein
MKNLLLTMIITLGLLGSFASKACGSPDSTTRVGALISVDKDAGQFTILDMILGTPIGFNADAQILLDLDGTKATI